jgi:hypothetical protein
MKETKMFFPITQTEFWKKFRIIIEEVITEILSQQFSSRQMFMYFESVCFFEITFVIFLKLQGKYSILSRNQKSLNYLELMLKIFSKEKY